MLRLQLLMLVLRLEGTVDRVEGPWAVVEWSEGQFTDLPRSAFTRAPHEGEVLKLLLRPHWEGAHLALPGETPRLISSEGLLDLPWTARLRPGHRYTACIQLPEEASCWSPFNPSPKEQETWKPRPRKTLLIPATRPSREPSSSLNDSTEKEP